jgi:hypothetical protein
MHIFNAMTHLNSAFTSLHIDGASVEQIAPPKSKEMTHDCASVHARLHHLSTDRSLAAIR